MTIIGLVGGIAPESTIAYYRLLVAGHRVLHPDSYPRVVINSIDMSRMLRLLARDDKSDAIAFLAGEAERLRTAGAAFGAFASNTPHLVFPQVEAATSLPLVSIVEVTADAIARSGTKRVGLLGTRFTMDGGFYQGRLAERGIDLVVPSAGERHYVNDIYFGELVKGDFRSETRQRLLDIIARLVRDQGVEQVILGGTELPLILTADHPAAVPLVDTTQVHVQALLARAEQTA